MTNRYSLVPCEAKKTYTPLAAESYNGKDLTCRMDLPGFRYRHKNEQSGKQGDDIRPWVVFLTADRNPIRWIYTRNPGKTRTGIQVQIPTNKTQRALVETLKNV